MTQAQIIKKVLENDGGWVNSYDLIKVNTQWGWLGSGADREARRLAKIGEIDRKREGKYTMYRYARTTLFGLTNSLESFK